MPTERLADLTDDALRAYKVEIKAQHYAARQLMEVYEYILFEIDQEGDLRATDATRGVPPTSV